MSTLGEKVTDTIVGGVARGVTGFTAAQHKDMQGIIGPRVAAYIDSLPADSPVRKELEHMQTDSTFSDMVVTMLGLIIGMIGSLWALGEPIVEGTRQSAWFTNPSKILNPLQATRAYWWGHMTAAQYRECLEMNGYIETVQPALLAGMRPGMALDEVRDASLRGLLGQQDTFKGLERLGYTPQENGVLQQLFWRLPGVQDLVRMAVREAFTPEIARKFGQYEDLPVKFTELAAKLGLSPEVSSWYWAAHWELPSVSQAYEMLHRGVIDQATLELLLRAQDVMPFWRDKLTAIAYNPLTRVDVRRMYHLGVLTEAQVTKAYQDLGYNAENAAKLLEFTKQYYGPEDEDPEEEDRSWTKAEILDGYRKRILTADQARTALREMGYPEDKANWYLAREDLKAAQSLKDAYVTRWRNLYINGVASADEVNTNLTALGMTEAELAELLPLWHLDKIMAVQRPTKAEITRWLKAGIITEAAWAAEMQLYGYSERYISWYLAEIKSQPELAIHEEPEG